MLDDARVHADARAAATDFEGRLLYRAQVLGVQQGLGEAILRWQARARVVFSLAILLSMVTSIRVERLAKKATK